MLKQPVLISSVLIYRYYNVFIGPTMTISYQSKKKPSFAIWGCIIWLKIRSTIFLFLDKSRSYTITSIIFPISRQTLCLYWQNLFSSIFLNSFLTYCTPPIGHILEYRYMQDRGIQRGLFQHPLFCVWSSSSVVRSKRTTKNNNWLDLSKYFHQNYLTEIFLS